METSVPGLPIEPLCEGLVDLCVQSSAEDLNMRLEKMARDIVTFVSTVGVRTGKSATGRKTDRGREIASTKICHTVLQHLICKIDVVPGSFTMKLIRTLSGWIDSVLPVSWKKVKSCGNLDLQRLFIDSIAHFTDNVSNCSARDHLLRFADGSIICILIPVSYCVLSAAFL